MDVNTEQAIVPRRGLNQINDSSDLVPSRYGGHNGPAVLIPSQNYQALTIVSHYEAIAPARNVDQAERSPKRYRIDYEHANAALEAPGTYYDAICSPQAKMGKDTIMIVLHALYEKKTWSAVTKTPGHKAIGTK